MQSSLARAMPLIRQACERSVAPLRPRLLSRGLSSQTGEPGPPKPAEISTDEAGRPLNPNGTPMDEADMAMMMQEQELKRLMGGEVQTRTRSFNLMDDVDWGQGMEGTSDLPEDAYIEDATDVRVRRPVRSAIAPLQPRRTFEPDRVSKTASRIAAMAAKPQGKLDASDLVAIFSRLSDASPGIPASKSITPAQVIEEYALTAALMQRVNEGMIDGAAGLPGGALAPAAVPAAQAASRLEGAAAAAPREAGADPPSSPAAPASSDVSLLNQTLAAERAAFDSSYLDPARFPSALDAESVKTGAAVEAARKRQQARGGQRLFGGEPQSATSSSGSATSSSGSASSSSASSASTSSSSSSSPSSPNSSTPTSAELEDAVAAMLRHLRLPIVVEVTNKGSGAAGLGSALHAVATHGQVPAELASTAKLIGMQLLTKDTSKDASARQQWQQQQQQQQQKQQQQAARDAPLSDGHLASSRLPGSHYPNSIPGMPGAGAGTGAGAATPKTTLDMGDLADGTERARQMWQAKNNASQGESGGAAGAASAAGAAATAEPDTPEARREAERARRIAEGLPTVPDDSKMGPIRLSPRAEAAAMLRSFPRPSADRVNPQLIDARGLPFHDPRGAARLREQAGFGAQGMGGVSQRSRGGSHQVQQQQHEQQQGGAGPSGSESGERVRGSFGGYWNADPRASRRSPADSASQYKQDAAAAAAADAAAKLAQRNTRRKTGFFRAEEDL